MSLFSDVQSGLQSGFGKSLTSAVSGKLPQVGKILNQAPAILNDLENGNFTSLGQRLLSGGGFNSGDNFFNTRSSAFAGLSPAEAFQVYKKQRGIRWCFKNLWFIEVSSELKGENELINMLCSSLDYSPFTVTGEKKQIGSAHVDLVNSSDPVELTMTCYDNKTGDFKRWCEDHAVACASSDGTVGVPANYAIRIKITHAFVNRTTNQGSYESVGLFRFGNITHNLTRAEQSLSEITASFVQLDTFMST